MTASDSSSFIVTLVHGTFAKGAPWVQAKGTIGSALKARFGDAVAIEDMEWSGGNHFKARREAAEKLRTHVMLKRDGMEGAKHVVVAHSHAGNIVSYAARDAAVNDRLAAVVTLAAPFIVARRRNLGWSGKVASQAFVLWLVLGLFYLIDSLWVSAWMPWQKTALFVALVALVEVPGLLLAHRWAESSEAFLEQLGHAEILRERLLILRAVADEATGVITLLQFPSLAATLVLANLAKITDRYVLWCARLVERPILAILFCLVAWAAVFIPGFLILWLTGSKLLFYVTLIVFMCLSYGPVIFLLLRNLLMALAPAFGPILLLLAMVTASGPIALLAAPIVLILAITLLGFGPRFAIANIYLDISVEATPIGEYEVTLLSPSSAGDPDTPGGLLHSALYDDERAVKLICDFIAARLT
ncbi:MAG: hypothetical protein AABN34_26495 [Acidobacteriota bacterium]